MTKNFCDVCKKEVLREYVKMSFMGNIKKYVYKQVCFCEECFTKVDKEIAEFMPKETVV